MSIDTAGFAEAEPFVKLVDVNVMRKRSIIMQLAAQIASGILADPTSTADVGSELAKRAVYMAEMIFSTVEKSYPYPSCQTEQVG